MKRLTIKQVWDKELAIVSFAVLFAYIIYLIALTVQIHIQPTWYNIDIGIMFDFSMSIITTAVLLPVFTVFSWFVQNCIAMFFEARNNRKYPEDLTDATLGF